MAKQRKSSVKLECQQVWIVLWNERGNTVRGQSDRSLIAANDGLGDIFPGGEKHAEGRGRENKTYYHRFESPDELKFKWV